MILAGLRMSMRGRRAARVKSASAEMPRPGAMAPPRNSPLAEIDVEGGRGAEVDDDDGWVGERSAVVRFYVVRCVAEDVEGGDGVDDADGADLGGSVGEDGQAGADARLDEERLGVEVALLRPCEVWSRVADDG